MNPTSHPADMYYERSMMDCKDVCTPPHMAGYKGLPHGDMCGPPNMPGYYYPQHGMDPALSPGGYPGGPNCMGMTSPNMPVYPWMRQTNGGE